MSGTIMKLGGTLLALGTPLSLQAQAVSPNSEPSATAATVADDGLQDIVVTAQKRSERQQDVPISITTVTSDAALRAGVVGTESLGRSVPALQFSRQTGNGATPFVRGVGTTSAIAGTESPVALYIDDVYIGAPAAALSNFNNIDQIEVLKGPQGTLFGRNATGGVVSIRTRKPSQDSELDLTAGYGSYNSWDGSLYANTPVTPQLAVNFAAQGHHQADGYGRNLSTGQDIYKDQNYSARGEALWTPTDTTKLLVIGDYGYDKGDIGMNVTVLPGAVSTGGGVYRGRYRATGSPSDFNKAEQYGFSARLDQDLGAVRLASISAYRHVATTYQIDNDSVPANILSLYYKSKTRTFSQEVQILAPTNSRLQWILGGYYFNSVAGYDPVRFSGAAMAAYAGNKLFIYDTQHLQSYAGFAEASYELLSQTKLTGGLRYTADHYQFNVLQTDANGSAVLNTPFRRSSNFSKLTYRAVLDHHFTHDIMGYASYSRGFKSGGYNLSAPTIGAGGAAVPAPVVAPEVLDAYEIGLKTELFNRKLRLNVAAFRYDYRDMQVTTIGLGTSTTINAASARMKGVDIDFDAAPLRNLRITGGVSFLDAKFRSFPNGPLNVPKPAVCSPVPTQTGPATGGNLTCAVDLAGMRTTRSPKFVGTISATYTVPTTAGDFAFSTSLYHNSGFFWEADNRVRQPRYDLLTASLGWTSPDGRYDLRFWGKNLTNAYYFTYASESGIRDSGSPDMPRTFGFTAGLHLK